ncbi:MAG TPA: TonB-dependent receptor [Steroidobacter sp.]|uniref:TonB-dependent receptor domain-containing protein n=1 Tax=Steroidobacter sp. TaxID=1978227 RepID=UPI002ED81078
MSSYLRSSIHTALLATALAGAGAANAAEPDQTAFIEEIEVIVVTGSYIEGAAEDAALPIDVLRAEDLAKQGSPSMVELIKQIPAVQGVVGESNQFTAPNTSGTANINLRGLGGVRTLVLMNGRRLAQSPAGTIGYDVNLLPTAAMGRIEILKDGAAATYGSDAVAGVVNFITKRGYEGLNLEGSYNYIDGSDGDYSANLLWGTKGDDWDVLVAGGYRHRSELSTRDRDFALRPITENPNGGYSSVGNPGAFSIINAAGAATSFRDPGCTELGNIESRNPVTGGPQCTFQFTPFNNLVEREEHYNVYSEFNKLFGESTELHVEAMYAVHQTPEENSSPSYGPTVGPNLTLNADGTRSVTGPTFSVPVDNPGFTQQIRDLIAAQPGGAAALAGAQSLRFSGLSWRPFGAGGNPLTGEGKQDERNFDAFRISTSLNGEASLFNWDVGVTFMETTREVITPDIITTRLQAALNGLGGPNCTGTTPGAPGCLWLNPFSSAVQMNAATGAINDLTYNPNTVNTAELASWLFQENAYEDTASTFVVDAVFNGQLPFGFAAGDIGWAAGLQYREETLERDPNDLTDLTKNPCVDSLSGNMNCNVQTGLFTFLGGFTPLDLSRDIKAVFTEFSVPILESLSAQVAVRYEDYGSPTGSTTNPKFSARWQALDWLTFRGSVGTTFRGPQQTQLAGTSATTLALISAVQQYKTFDVVGDPNLEPEEAFTFNVGTIVKAGGFSASLDYWSYDFEKSLEVESGGEMISTFFRPTPNGFANGCTDPAYAGLRSRFQFNGSCSLTNLLRVTTKTINGPDQQLSGIDGSVSYLFDGVFLGTDILVGADATYTLEYEREALFVEGIMVQAADDFVGTRGASGLGAGSLPEIRGAAYVDFANANQGLRLTARYVDGVKDVRTSLDQTVPAGLNVGSFLTYDAVYRLSLPGETTITASVINLTDEDPPLTRLDLSYDPFLANPYGRYYKLLLNKKF